MPYVYSTITNSTCYCEYENRGNNIPVLKRKIEIKGGTGVATKHLITPLGVVTRVTDEDLDFLLQNESFKRHMKRGFISIDKEKIEPEVKAANMETRDESSPMVPQDYNDNDPAKPAEGAPQTIKGRLLNKLMG